MLTKVKKLYPDAKIPTQTHKTDAGYDVYVHHVEDCGHYIKAFLGIAIEPEEGFWFALVPRSSIYKRGLTLYNNFGVVDVDYRGQIIALFLKTTGYSETNPLVAGDRIAQLIPQKQITTQFVETDTLMETQRGSGGLGSTGTN